jgi:hypothetical protein
MHDHTSAPSGIITDKPLVVSFGSCKLSLIAIALYHEAGGPLDIGIRDHYSAVPLAYRGRG